jgi:hypothetical protein
MIMEKELITPASVEAVLKDISEDDRRALSFYTHIIMMAFANKGGYKAMILFENDDTSGVAAINMTELEVVSILEETHENMCKMITKDMPPKGMLN